MGDQKLMMVINADQLDVFSLGYHTSRRALISVGQASIKVSHPNLSSYDIVSNFATPVFEKAGAGVCGMVSVFPAERFLCVSDAEAAKVSSPYPIECYARHKAK